ncbi:MAG: Dabb family protein [Planctomycetes bacterium]|nr:Dabb family protein [Planctomycetota bacterium]
MTKYKHIVLLRFPPQTARETIAEIFEAIDELEEKIPGIIDITSGTYESPEGLNQGFTHAFVVTFSDVASRDQYLEHPAHEPVKNLIVDAIGGDLKNVLAFDFKLDDRFRY